jgi:hypothetical protein
MLGTLAAVEAPSRTRVKPMTTSAIASSAAALMGPTSPTRKRGTRPVTTTATAPKMGPYCITRWKP